MSAIVAAIDAIAEVRIAIRHALGHSCFGCGKRTRLDIHHAAHDGTEHRRRLGIDSLLATKDGNGMFAILEYYCDIFLDVRRNLLHGYVLLCRKCHKTHHETFGYN